MVLSSLALRGLQQELRQAGLPGHQIQGAAVLAHGPLPQDLAGEDEVEALGRHHRPGLPDHQGVAVDAGVVPLAEAVGRRIEQRLEFFSEINFFQGQAELGRGLPGLHRPVKGRDETDEGDVNSLGAQDRPGQHTVQPPGQEA